MHWLIGFVMAVVILASAIVLTIVRSRSTWTSLLLTTENILFVGVALASVALYIPMYINDFQSSDCGVIETLLISVHNMIRLFVVDCDFEFIKANINDAYGWLGAAYSVLFSALFVAAPLLTFGFVLSFFQNLAAYKRFYWCYRYDLYVFSSLNERSLALANSLSQTSPKRTLLIFTGVNDEMCGEAQMIGALCFKKDIHAIDFTKHSRNSRIVFFALTDNDAHNTADALQLLSRYGEREHTDLYVFSTQTEAEMLFSAPNVSAAKRTAVKVRLINEHGSLVYRELYENGASVFQHAIRAENEQEAQIGAVVIGMDGFGFQMVKNLPWFCQMDGYNAHIWAFSEEPDSRDRFAAMCPELLDKRCNDYWDDDGEARYSLSIEDGVRTDSREFYEALLTLPCVTYVFVSCGDDEKNLHIAVQVRSLFERYGKHPVIKAVVGNVYKNEALRYLHNYKGDAYDIDVIGDLNTRYDCRAILDGELEQTALKRHLKWGTEEDFWRFGYNYNSSVASAIHHKMKLACGIGGADICPAERQPDDRMALRKLEHRRWNAYMRSQGYVYAEHRNDLAKTHPCLVSFDRLDEADQMKDDD